MSEDAYQIDMELQMLQKQFPEIHKEVIVSVAEACHYDLQRTACYLFEMCETNTQGARKKKPKPASNDEVRIIQFIQEGFKVVVLMRGLPGSGKSVLAHEIFRESGIELSPAKFILSTDDYFNKNGQYIYDFSQLEKAHHWNQTRCYTAMKDGISPIIIDNTNLVKWEMRPYCEMAVECGYVIEILEPSTKWARDPHVLAQKNVHNVPKDKIVHMLNKFDKNLTTTSLLREYQLRYDEHMPQKRRFPPLMVMSSPLNSYPDLSAIESSRFSSATNIGRSESFDFSFEKKAVEKELPIMEYVHNFDDINISDTKKRDEITEESRKNKELQNVIEESARPTVFSRTPEVVSLEMKAPSNLVKLVSNESNAMSNEAKAISNQLHMVSNDPNVVSNDPKILSYVPKVVFNEPAVVPNEPKAVSNEQLMDLIDFMDDGNSAATPSRASFGAYPLMPTQAPIKSNSDSDIQSKKMKSNDGNTKYSPASSNAHLTAWGTNEKALQSWEAVVPMKPDYSEISVDFEILKKIEENSSRMKTQMSDKTTNTQSEDFKFAQSSPNVNGKSILKAQSRLINNGSVVVKSLPPRKKITVDMGCMTDEHEHESGDHVKQLRDVFPNIPIKYMLDVYEKCKKDLAWTIDLLSDSDYVLKADEDQNKAGSVEEAMAIEEAPRLNSWEFLDAKQPDDLESEAVKRVRQQEILELKRKLEENVNFGKDHYSEHVWELKNQRHRTTALVQESSVEEEAENTDGESDSVEEDPDDTIQVSLGDVLVGQLEKVFGNEDFVNTKFHTTIQLPVSLAKQIHALYLQSVCHQIEEQNELINKDEEYAHRLDTEQREALKGPDLNTIMDEQLAQFYRKKDMEQYKSMSPDNLAIILKKRKLYEAFPSVNHAIIDNLLQSQNNNYERCAEMLIGSVNQSFIVPIKNLRETPITDDVIKDMKANKAIIDQVSNDDRTAQEYRTDAIFYGQKLQQLHNLAQSYHKKGWGEVAVFYSKLAEDMKTKRDFANQKATYMHLRQNTLKLTNSDTLDLHFLTVKEALTSLDVFVDTRVSKLDKKTKEDCFVITGRGKNNPSGRSKLKPAIIARLKKRNIRYLEMNPGLLKIKLRKDLTMSTDLKK